jgi:hypothetical protein
MAFITGDVIGCFADHYTVLCGLTMYLLEITVLYFPYHCQIKIRNWDCIYKSYDRGELDYLWNIQRNLSVISLKLICLLPEYQDIKRI